jgi:hypothetical protein
MACAFSAPACNMAKSATSVSLSVGWVICMAGPFGLTPVFGNDNN